MKEQYGVTTSIFDEQKEEWMRMFNEALNDVKNTKDVCYPVIAIANA